MRHILTDPEVDALPSPYFQVTGERIRIRREWGRRAGHAAFNRGDTQNPFWKRPCLPMHEAWAEGYADAKTFASALPPVPVAPGGAG